MAVGTLLYGYGSQPGAEKSRARKLAARAMEQEELLMQALAEAEENGVPDDGAIEIDSDDEFQP
ncbi:hypothetical protein B0H10DRAFT_2227544 [Mycena sp. CBHHK59/15]|nr:hypothetical protein B0H10DRAFT_2227544 [Mycena sp. CBHHK59/15]